MGAIPKSELESLNQDGDSSRWHWYGSSLQPESCVYTGSPSGCRFFLQSKFHTFATRITQQNSRLMTSPLPYN